MGRKKDRLGKGPGKPTSQAGKPWKSRTFALGKAGAGEGKGFAGSMA